MLCSSSSVPMSISENWPVLFSSSIATTNFLRQEKKSREGVHTRAVEWQGSEGGGVFGALGKCTSIEIDVVGWTQDEDALAELQE